MYYNSVGMHRTAQKQQCICSYSYMCYMGMQYCNYLFQFQQQMIYILYRILLGIDF